MEEKNVIFKLQKNYYAVVKNKNYNEFFPKGYQKIDKEIVNPRSLPKKTYSRKYGQFESDDHFSTEEEFIKYLPPQLTDEEKIEVYNLVSPVVKEQLNENASYSKDIDIIEKCAQLTNYMRDKGYNIDPVPAVEFVNGDTENAKDFFGKTAYYDPNEQKIVLYTKDVIQKILYVHLLMK